MPDTPDTHATRAPFPCRPANGLATRYNGLPIVRFDVGATMPLFWRLCELRIGGYATLNQPDLPDDQVQAHLNTLFQWVQLGGVSQWLAPLWVLKAAFCPPGESDPRTRYEYIHLAVTGRLVNGSTAQLWAEDRAIFGPAQGSDHAV